MYAWLGVEPPRGVLLHGPPGCGKTALANAIANHCGVPFLRVSAPEIVSGMSGKPTQCLKLVPSMSPAATPLHMSDSKHCLPVSLAVLLLAVW